VGLDEESPHAQPPLADRAGHVGVVAVGEVPVGVRGRSRRILTLGAERAQELPLISVGVAGVPVRDRIRLPLDDEHVTGHDVGHLFDESLVAAGDQIDLERMAGKLGRDEELQLERILLRQ